MHYGAGGTQSVFEELEGKTIRRLTVSELKKKGFKLLAGANTPWTQLEINSLKIALQEVNNDSTLIGDYAKIERYIAQYVLGGSRTESAVLKKLNELVNAKKTDRKTEDEPEKRAPDEDEDGDENENNLNNADGDLDRCGDNYNQMAMPSISLRSLRADRRN